MSNQDSIHSEPEIISHEDAKNIDQTQPERYPTMSYCEKDTEQNSEADSDQDSEADSDQDQVYQDIPDTKICVVCIEGEPAFYTKSLMTARSYAKKYLSKTFINRFPDTKYKIREYIDNKNPCVHFVLESRHYLMFIPVDYTECEIKLHIISQCTFE